MADFSHFRHLARPLKRIGHTAARRNGLKSREEDMIVIGKIGQSMIAVVAAAVLTVTAVGAAVGPARAIETAPVSLAVDQISGQVYA
jgi:hypothetical protein